ncbi:MAG: hypothetical protein CMK06_11400 [Ponticaulis sp.]|nr:hypothetical protein [Ponticaulis sp.]
MYTHTNDRPVTFRRPFTLDGIEETFPPGEYIIQTVIESLNEPAHRSYRTIATQLVVKAGTNGHAEERMIDIDPKALQKAFTQDSRIDPAKKAAKKAAAAA